MAEASESCRLSDTVLVHLDQIVFAFPIYGWGWGEGEGVWSNSTATTHVEVPSPFHFKVDSFFDWNGERRGGIGQIIQPRHLYDQRWLLFFIRVCGVFDFNSDIADYNFYIANAKPCLHPPSYDPVMAQRWPLPDLTGRSVHGFGLIGSTCETITEFEEHRRREAKRQRHA
ncbi:MAG TPA: hypothetical protein VFZ59_22815 [Verrucomicrobiae bacterium]|nr:hypothetical protein [Verrucomicrobiae bacterium]